MTLHNVTMRAVDQGGQPWTLTWSSLSEASYKMFSLMEEVVFMTFEYLTTQDDEINLE